MIINLPVWMDRAPIVFSAGISLLSASSTPSQSKMKIYPKGGEASSW